MENEAALFHQRSAPTPGKLAPSPIGSMNFNVLRAILEEHRLLKLNRGAEIGVFRADTSSHLLQSFPELQMYCIDPYVAYVEHEGDKTQAKMSECETTARSRLAPFGDRVTLIKDFSLQAASRIPDAALDFVFIDAIHSFEAVSADLQAWFPKVRPGGMIAGHDFRWGGIQEAVEQFIAPLGIGGFFSPSTSDVWFFQKGNVAP